MTKKGLDIGISTHKVTRGKDLAFGKFVDNTVKNNRQLLILICLMALSIIVQILLEHQHLPPYSVKDITGNIINTATDY